MSMTCRVGVPSAGGPCRLAPPAPSRIRRWFFFSVNSLSLTTPSLAKRLHSAEAHFDLLGYEILFRRGCPAAAVKAPQRLECVTHMLSTLFYWCSSSRQTRRSSLSGGRVTQMNQARTSSTRLMSLRRCPRPDPKRHSTGNPNKMSKPRNKQRCQPRHQVKTRTRQQSHGRANASPSTAPTAMATTLPARRPRRAFGARRRCTASGQTKASGMPRKPPTSATILSRRRTSATATATSTAATAVRAALPSSLDVRGRGGDRARRRVGLGVRLRRRLDHGLRRRRVVDGHVPDARHGQPQLAAHRFEDLHGGVELQREREDDGQRTGELDGRLPRPAGRFSVRATCVLLP